jgi:D-amino-acid dehydrogenase
MQVIVMGAGVVGVTTAWYLAAAGHEVTVVERQNAPALETSFANGGQISVSHAEPWANPGALLKVIKWIGHEDSPLLWRLRADLAQWRWGLDFLRQCTPYRTRQNIQAIVRIGLFSRTHLRALRAQLGLDYDALQKGILHFYTNEREFDSAVQQAAVMQKFGCDRRPVTGAECMRIEPALTNTTVPIVGGTFTADDESGDARKFTEQLAMRCSAAGVRFRFDTEILALQTHAGQLASIRLSTGETLVADAYVLALGSYSPRMLNPLGVRLPVYPAKGYSATITLGENQEAPVTSLTDDGYKLVFSRLGKRLRVAGTAEFNGYDLSINPLRCRSLMKRATQVFPDIQEGPNVEYWTGLRPATPGNVPVIGPCSVEKLWINSGHGTLGWTLACGSAQLLADQLSGRQAGIDHRPYAPVF